ncbi:MAG: hypothetical protein ACREWE_00025 [Gammaproteobacteria bacterium]
MTEGIGRRIAADKGEDRVAIELWRDLDLIGATPDRAAHASAASGLVQIGDYARDHG